MYNPYQPYNYGGTYIPNYNFQNPYQQFNQNLTQQQTQPQQTMNNATNTNKIFVAGIDDVKSRNIPFNSDFIFLDNDKPYLYQKSVDSKGQFEIKAFEIREIKAQEQAKKENTIDLSNYVTTNEFDAIKGQINDLKTQIDKLAIQEKINNLNSIPVKNGGNNEPTKTK